MTLLHSVGAQQVLRGAKARVWSTNIAFGLCCELSDIPPARPARIPLAMVAVDPGSFRGFADELELAAGLDYLEVRSRAWMCERGVDGLHVAFDPAGRPIYAQWLVDARTQESLHAVTGDLFPWLEDHEALVEGAYTFAAFRKLGAMADGMRQLLCEAADRGATRCYTYVTADNVPSLRGCAKAGFGPDHMRETVKRLGTRRFHRRPCVAQDQSRWSAATQTARPTGA